MSTLLVRLIGLGFAVGVYALIHFYLDVKELITAVKAVPTEIVIAQDVTLTGDAKIVPPDAGPPPLP